MMKMYGLRKRAWPSCLTAVRIISHYILKIFLNPENWIQKQLPRNPRQLLLMEKNILQNFII